MRKWLLTLAVCVGLGLVTVVWLGVDDARQAALLDARAREAEDRFYQALAWKVRLIEDDAPEAQVFQAELESRRAIVEIAGLCRERQRREHSWPARLRQEIRRRTGR